MRTTPCAWIALAVLAAALAPGRAAAGDLPSLAAYGPFVDFEPSQEVESRTADASRGGRLGWREGTSAITVSGGLTVSPETTLAAFELDHFVTDRVAVGPLLQVGLSSDEFVFAPSMDVKLFGEPLGGELRGLSPFVQGGIGFAYIDDNGRGTNGREDVGLLLAFGFGADFFVTDRLSLGTSLLFDVLPSEVEGEDFFFSWQIVTFSIHF
jgi:hypothetical protein